MSNDGWVVGAKVSACNATPNGPKFWGPVREVEKVYKNGNVLIRGLRYKTKGEFAFSLGSSSNWSYGPYVLLTPARASHRIHCLAGAQHRKRVQDALAALARCDGDVPLEVVEAIERSVMISADE